MQEPTSRPPAFPVGGQLQGQYRLRLAQDAADALDVYRNVLKCFGPAPEQDENQLSEARQLAISVRTGYSHEWDIDLAAVPKARDPKHPSDGDFAELQEWFVTTAIAMRKHVQDMSARWRKADELRFGANLEEIDLKLLKKTGHVPAFRQGCRP